jgi:iron(III) transport system substrate-binding protein
MLSRRSFTLAGLACAVSGCGLESSPHSRLEAAATKEGALRIDATTDQSGLEDLLDAFRRGYPNIAVEYHRPPSKDLYVNFVGQVSSGKAVADILISSAMDLQFKLVNDGYAQTHVSSQKAFLPSWAVWKDQAYAVTAEPIIFAYNRALMPPEDVPASHEDLADLLRRKPDAYRGRIATYDPERSGTGYLYYTQDLLLSRDTLDLTEVVGHSHPKFYVSGSEVNESLSTGTILLAYNMVSSYVFERQTHDPNIGVVFPNDYTLVMSRIAFVPKAARHPAAGKLFLDFMLSETGQSLLTRRYMQPIRTGMPATGQAPPSPEVLRPIHFGPSLLANLDEFRRRSVLRAWHHSLES